jgi:hypothetical protein
VPQPVFKTVELGPLSVRLVAVFWLDWWVSGVVCLRSGDSSLAACLAGGAWLPGGESHISIARLGGWYGGG